MLQHYTLPQELLLLNGFARGHHLRARHLGHAGRTLEKGCDDSPRKGSYCSKVTWPNQSEKIKENYFRTADYDILASKEN